MCMWKLKGHSVLFWVLLCAFVAAGQISRAGEAFQNNLLKMNIAQSSGGLSVTLFTNKPYEDIVSVNKKSDFQYVILLPETANSLVAKPSIKSVSSLVRGIDVKTQQYQNQVKGYTKITISTVEPVKITPHIQTLSKNQLNENDYNELMAQAVKKKAPSVKKQTSVSTAKKKIQPEQISASKTINVKKVASKPKTQTVSNSIKTQAKAPVIQKQAVKVSTSTNRVAKIEKPVPKAPKKVESIAKSTLKPQVKPELVRPIVADSRVTEEPKEDVVTPSVAENSVSTPDAAVPVPDTVQPARAGLKFKDDESGYQKKIKNLIKRIELKVGGGIYTVLGLALIPVLLFLLLLRLAGKTANKIRQQKSDFAQNLKESPVQATDYSENIEENMTWKEKFQTYVDSSTSQGESTDTEAEGFEPKINEVQSNPELEGLFGEGPMEDLFEDSELESSEFVSNVDLTAADVFEDLSGTVTAEEDIVAEEIIVPSVGDQYSAVDDQEEDGVGLKDGLSELSELDELDEILAQDCPDTCLDEDISLDDLFGEEEPSEVDQDNVEEGFEEEVLDAVPAFVSELDLEEVEEENEEEDNFVKSEFVIDAEKGLYLVDFEETTALVGHIDDEIFVLKRFDEKVAGVLQARLNEKKGESASYMTRVGSFKGIVEVTPRNMKLLIEL